MKLMTNELKIKIQKYVKNRMDISDLISDVNIQNMDLSGAIIKIFNRPEDNISNTNFSRAIIGEEGKIINLSGTTMKNCIFQGAKFLGKTWMRRVDARGSNFNGAFIPYWDYRFANFEGCNFCDAIICIGTKEGLGAQLDKGFMKDLTKHWKIKVITDEQYEEYQKLKSEKENKL